MANIEVHFHCAFVGKGKFRITMTPTANPENVGVIEVTEIELGRFFKNIRRGQGKLQVGRLRVELDAGYVARIREYIELVLATYQDGIDRGIDHDAKLREWRDNIDPAGGSGTLPGE